MRQTSGRHHDLLAEHGFEVRYPAVDRPLRSDELAELISGCSSAILGLDEVDATVLATDGLRVIVRYGTGMDNVDMAAARRYGVLVANTPGANSVSVAELAIALMFAVARRIPVLDRSARDGSWRRMAGIELAGGRLGLVGIGAVGREVAMRAQALGMDVVAFDPMAASAPVPLVAFDDLLATSDVVSLHCPLTEDTAGLFDAEALGAMKPGSILVNTSRGGLVDEVALAAAVSAGAPRRSGHRLLRGGAARGQPTHGARQRGPHSALRRHDQAGGRAGGRHCRRGGASGAGGRADAAPCRVTSRTGGLVRLR